MKIQKRMPRKAKKKIKKSGTLIYDVASLPRSYTIMQIYHGFRNMGVVLWCSDAKNNLGGIDISCPPTVVNGVKKIKIVDVSKIDDNGR